LFVHRRCISDMTVREEFDEWAREGRDKGMEERHWHTAKHALARMPVEEDDFVLDLGTGSGYALRALRETKEAGRCYGIDASPEMLTNARSYTDDTNVAYVRGRFGALPFGDRTIDHIFSMEAFYYADTHEALREIRRVLRPGGTFYCAVNFFEESKETHVWQEKVDVEMTLWNRADYRKAFREAGLYVAEQDCIPDREVEIPPQEEFPTEDWETREEMYDRYRRWGTLLTVGVAP